MPIVILCAIDGSAPAEELDYYPGSARFKADYGTVFFPAEIRTLFFDTLECQGCRDSLPPWRFIGDLKIDSIIRKGVTEPFVRESLIYGVQINSPELISVIKKNNCYLLGRRIWDAVPYDTLGYSRSGQDQVVVPDLSKHFYIAFDSLRNAKDIVAQLKAVPNLKNVGLNPKPMGD